MIVLLAILTTLSASTPYSEPAYFPSGYYELPNSTSSEIKYSSTSPAPHHKADDDDPHEGEADEITGWIFLTVAITSITVFTFIVVCYSAYRHGKFRACHAYFVEKWGPYLPRILAGSRHFEKVDSDDVQLEDPMDELGIVTDTGDSNPDVLD